MDEGPTWGRTAMPMSCAMATTVAPGSATAGQPASDTRPMSWPARAGLSQSRSSPGLLPRLSRVWMVISCKGAAVPTSFRKARAVLAFSAMKTVSSRVRAWTSAGSQPLIGLSPSPTGIRCREAAWGMGRDFLVWVGQQAGLQGVEAEMAQHGAQLDQGQADDGGGIIRTHALHEGDAQAFGLGAAGRVVGPLHRQVVFDFRVGQGAE